MDSEPLEAVCWLRLGCWSNNAAIALVHSTAEHCVPGWCRSAHNRLIDPVINDAFRIVTGCLRSTPVDNLPILAGIEPTELRRNGAWTSAPLSAYLSTRWECTASQIETPICARRTTTDQFTWQQKCGSLVGSPMECGVVGPHYETP